MVSISWNPGGIDWDQRVVRINPAEYPARAIFRPTARSTASATRRLSSSEGWLVDRGFMGSLILEGELKETKLHVWPLWAQYTP